MWEFRRDPKDLKPEEREALERLFAELPVLKDVYEIRLRFKEIFDTAPDYATAEQQLAVLACRPNRSAGLQQVLDDLRQLEDGNLELLRRAVHQCGGGRDQQQGPRDYQGCYGVKSSDTLWNRLILDLNRAAEAAVRTIGELREIVGGLKAVFLRFCT